MIYNVIVLYGVNKPGCQSICQNEFFFFSSTHLLIYVIAVWLKQLSANNKRVSTQMSNQIFSSISLLNISNMAAISALHSTQLQQRFCAMGAQK